MMRHPCPFIAWDLDWPWSRLLLAVIWNALLIGVIVGGVAFLVTWLVVA